MPQEIIDLDVVAGPPKKVRLGGRDWTLPADLPVEIYLKINQAEKDTAAAEQAATARGEKLDETAQFTELRDILLDLFQIHQPTLRALPRELGLVTLLQAIPKIYGPQGDPERPEGARPTRPRARAGTTSTRRRRASRRSRSSRS